MKKFFAALLVLVTLVIAVPSLVNASNWTKHHDDDYVEDCWHCGGSGKCEVCKGEGHYEDYDHEEVECYKCRGTGECYYCDGSGKG